MKRVILVAVVAWTGVALRAMAQQVPPAAAGAPQADSLTAAARRAADAWKRHDFAALVEGSPGVMVRLGRSEPSTAMPPAQAALTLRAFAGSAVEVETVVASVRDVDGSRAYAEIQRTYVAPGTEAQRTQTLYLGWRWLRGVPRLVEIRVVP